MPVSNLADPRVLFAAERTLLAWNRSALALMAFGFVLERSGLLLGLYAPAEVPAGGAVARWLGLAFILLGAMAALGSIRQYRVVLRTLTPAEIPPDYRLQAGVWLNGVVGLLGLALLALLAIGGG
jgi:putative membrane protein